MASTPPSSSLLEKESSNVKGLVEKAKGLFETTFQEDDERKMICSVAPGRVNLIGEHTDYTGGFVFPMAISYSTVCYGYGEVITSSETETSGTCEIISANTNKVVQFTTNEETLTPFTEKDKLWANYVLGVVAQYITVPDTSTKKNTFSFRMAIVGDVPLGSGLSSSASLEVAVATFVQQILQNKNDNVTVDKKTRALKCQKAENTFCGSPCGIMDQFVSSAGAKDAALLIDCRSLEYTCCFMGKNTNENDEKVESRSFPVIVVCNSNVTHSIAGGEYPIRVQQCKDAESILGQSLRDATYEEVVRSQDKMEDVTWRRAKHVVTENARTLQAKEAFENGDWTTMGKLMNESHSSMKNDYDVSCEEIDILVDLAQNHIGVYGSRLTGGGFGGCTVTLIDEDHVHNFIQYMATEYKKATGKDCFPFQTSPGPGARTIILS